MDFSCSDNSNHHHHKHKKKKHKHKQIKTEMNDTSEHTPLVTPTLPNTPTYISKPRIPEVGGEPSSSLGATPTALNTSTKDGGK